jgi:hypothetical protein
MGEMSQLDELDVVIRRKGGKVIAGIPSVGLYASADTVAAALDVLEARKIKYQSDLEEAGFTPDMEIPNRATAAPIATARSVPGDLRSFALKSLITIGLITAAIVLIGTLLVSKIDDTIAHTVYSIQTQLAPIANAKIGGSQFWTKVENEIERAANSNNAMAPEKQQKLLSNIRAIVTRVRPFVAEAAPLFSDLRSPDGQGAERSCK